MEPRSQFGEFGVPPSGGFVRVKSGLFVPTALAILRCLVRAELIVGAHRIPGQQFFATATDAFETACLEHYFQNTAHANVGDAVGVRGSTTAGVFYISLSTGTLTDTSTQATTEATYVGYARQSVARSAGGWTVSGGSVSNAAAVTFPICTSGSSTVTYFGIGSDSTGAGNLFLWGALTASLAITAGITPSFAIGQLTTTAD
jgi:hypothetical protein